MTELALIEFCHVFHCRRCKGTGVMRSQRDCRRCRGTGRERITEAARARTIGVSREAWSRIWRSRYAQLLAYLEAREQAVLDDLRRKLR